MLTKAVDWSQAKKENEKHEIWPNAFLSPRIMTQETTKIQPSIRKLFGKDGLPIVIFASKEIRLPSQLAKSARPVSPFLEKPCSSTFSLLEPIDSYPPIAGFPPVCFVKETADASLMKRWSVNQIAQMWSYSCTPCNATLMNALEVCVFAKLLL